MGSTATGAAEPRLTLEWPDRNVPTSAVLAAVHHVIADTYEARGDVGTGWLVIAPDRPERTSSTVTATIVARTWPGSAAEAAEALDVFHRVVNTSRRLLRELHEFASQYPELTDTAYAVPATA